LILSVLWVGWFGYVIYDSNRSASAAGDFIETCNIERRIGRPCAYDPMDVAVWQSQQRGRQRTAEKAILAFPIFAPVLYFICAWIVRGFRREETAPGHPEDVSANVSGNGMSKPGSTLLLILSILFSPILWLVDPGAMANFWVARGGRRDNDQN
jgi:hypothetical protein